MYFEKRSQKSLVWNINMHNKYAFRLLSDQNECLQLFCLQLLPQCPDDTADTPTADYPRGDPAHGAQTHPAYHSQAYTANCSETYQQGLHNYQFNSFILLSATGPYKYIHIITYIYILNKHIVIIVYTGYNCHKE